MFKSSNFIQRVVLGHQSSLTRVGGVRVAHLSFLCCLFVHILYWPIYSAYLLPNGVDRRAYKLKNHKTW
jgi:hypothetical protein